MNRKKLKTYATMRGKLDARIKRQGSERRLAPGGAGTGLFVPEPEGTIAVGWAVSEAKVSPEQPYALILHVRVCGSPG